MSVLDRVLAEHDDVVAPVLRIANDTRRKIHEILGDKVMDMDAAAFRADLLERPAFKTYARLVERFPLLRSRPFTEVLFFFFLDAGRGDEAPVLSFEEIAPLAHAVQRFERPSRGSAAELHPSLRERRALGRRGAEPPSKTQTTAAATFAALLRLASHLAKQGARAERVGQHAAGRVAAMHWTWVAFAREAQHFAGDPEALDRWLGAVNGVLDRWFEDDQEPSRRAELTAATLVIASAWFGRRRPDLLDVVVEDACLIARVKGWVAAAMYLQHAPLAVRRGEWLSYRGVVVELTDRHDLSCLRFLARAPRLLRARFPLSLIKTYLSPAAERPLDHNALLVLPEAGPVPSAVEVEGYFRTAARLAGVHAMAAAQYLRHVRTIRATLGAEFVSQWVAWGEELARSSVPEVAALYFAASSRLADVRSAPDETWFSTLREACAAHPRNIEWMRSDLWLRARRRARAGLPERWLEITEALRKRFPDGPDPRVYRLSGLSSRELRAHLTVLQRLADVGRRSFVHEPHVVEVPIRPVPASASADLRSTLCRALVARFTASPWAVPESHHPLAEKLGSAEISEELLLAAADRGRSRKLVSQEDMDLSEGTARPGDVIDLLLRGDVAHGEPGLLIQALARSIRRRRRYRALDRLLAELTSLPADTHEYDRIRWLVAPGGSLLDVLAGEATSSCTDGPTGSKRQFGVVHATHEDAFKILACRPHPRRGWAAPQPFASVPGFRARLPGGGRVLFVDSIEAGGEIYRLESDLDAVARGLSKILDEIAHDHRLPIYLPVRQDNVGGQRLMQAYRRAVLHEERRTDVILDASTLHALSIRRFYSEAIQRESAPGERSTKYLQRVPDVDVLVQART